MRRCSPILGTVIGASSVEILRSDVCGRVDGRLCESLVGDITTDAMRNKYASIGVEFAITNSGGLRDALTCPPAGGGSGLCPPSTPPPFLITRGQVLAVLPFGNLVVTAQRQRRGAEDDARERRLARCRARKVGSRRSRGCASRTTSRRRSEAG